MVKPRAGWSGNVLCLPNPEWLPHILTVSGSVGDLAAFRTAAAGPGGIPWVVDYSRLEEDWVLAMLTPPPSERGISVEGSRILAGRLRERVELQDLRAAETAVGDRRCALDLQSLLPMPTGLLRLGPDDPASIAWLWENWGTTWALRNVEEMPADSPPGQAALRIRFWSADWTPWRALAAMRSRWSSLDFQVSVRGVPEASDRTASTATGSLDRRQR